MPRVIWSSGNCMLYVRAEESLTRARERETRTRGREKGRAWGELAKNRGSFGYRQKSLVMVGKENEQEEDVDDVVAAREREQRKR